MTEARAISDVYRTLQTRCEPGANALRGALEKVDLPGEEFGAATSTCVISPSGRDIDSKICL